MPRKEPENAEYVLISPEDAELLDFFSLRRTFEDDGSIQYVQVIGNPALIEAARRGENLAEALPSAGKKSVHFSLSRMIMERMIGRPLLPNERVRQINGNRGDLRRRNLEIATASELASVKRSSWASSGVKYVYETKTGKYAAQVGDISLGTYSDKSEAAAAVEKFYKLLDAGLSKEEAKTRIVNRHRNKNRVMVVD
ncbi:MAG TPA: hypothetical protein VK003_21115 [Oceanobacillus sp.]|nr:hypothetical protein [Oceanobacillus sp.]